MVKILKIIYENKKQLLFIVVFILIVFSVFSLFKSCTFYGVDGAVETRARNEYSGISTEYLGKYLAEKYPDSKAVMIYDSISTSPVMENRISGIKKGLEGKIEILIEIGLPAKIPKDIPRHMIRSYEYIHADDFNRIMKRYPSADMIISLVGLPQDINRMDIWGMPNTRKRPKLIVYGGNPAELNPYIKHGYINALVVYRMMDKSVNQLPPSDLEEAFNRRFIMITPESLNNGND